MPFINQTDKRTVFQEAVPDQNISAPGFGETFTASVGLTIDEDLSISQSLNREGWQNRRELIVQKINEDAINRDDYLDRRGKFDWNRAATDLNDPNIKTDDVLEVERRDMLAGRRKYAEDVIERGNGMAQFLGMANAFMLDPISIATMPIALPATTAKSLSIAGRALLTARNAAVIETATELAIQPFVYEHKQDIESPYTYKDALQNIAGAAIGAGALGGIGGGVSGYLRKVRGEVEAKGVITPEVESALDNIKRMEDSITSYKAASRSIDDLSSQLEIDPKSIKSDPDLGDQFIIKFDDAQVQVAIREDADNIYLTNIHTKKTGDLTAEAKGTGRGTEILNRLKEYSDKTGKDFSIVDSTKPAKSFYERIPYLERSEVTLKFEGEDYTPEISFKYSPDKVKADIDYLEALEVERELVKRPQATPDQYQQPPQQKASSASTSQREAYILDENGVADDFNRDMQRYNELDDPRIIQDDEVVSAGEFMKSIDEELEGIDSVLTCAYG